MSWSWTDVLVLVEVSWSHHWLEAAVIIRCKPISLHPWNLQEIVDHSEGRGHWIWLEVSTVFSVCTLMAAVCVLHWEVLLMLLMLECLTAEVLRQESRRLAGRKKGRRRAAGRRLSHGDSVSRDAQGTASKSAIAGFSFTSALCRVHTDPGKSWNLKFNFSRPAQSWN